MFEYLRRNHQVLRGDRNYYTITLRVIALLVQNKVSEVPSETKRVGKKDVKKKNLFGMECGY